MAPSKLHSSPGLVHLYRVTDRCDCVVPYGRRRSAALRWVSHEELYTTFNVCCDD